MSSVGFLIFDGLWREISARVSRFVRSASGRTAEKRRNLARSKRRGFLRFTIHNTQFWYILIRTTRLDSGISVRAISHSNALRHAVNDRQTTLAFAALRGSSLLSSCGMASRPFTGLILAATLRSGFWGSIARRARWLQRDDIVRPFAHYSLSEVTMMIDDPNHSNGAAFIITRSPSVLRVR